MLLAHIAEDSEELLLCYLPTQLAADIQDSEASVFDAWAPGHAQFISQNSWECEHSCFEVAIVSFGVAGLESVTVQPSTGTKTEGPATSLASSEHLRTTTSC